jgi:hypothetical protein
MTEWQMKKAYEKHSGESWADAQPFTRELWESARIAARSRAASTSANAPNESGADTGNAEADRIIGRLSSSDPDFDDCIDAVAFIRKLVAEHKGPDGFATWKDAAIAERMQRVELGRAASRYMACRESAIERWLFATPEEYDAMVDDSLRKKGKEVLTGRGHNYGKKVAKDGSLYRPAADTSADVAQGAEAVAEDISLVRELQKALFYWMPAIAGEDSPAGQKAAEHAYLLIGCDGNSLDCYGDQMRSSLGIVNRELERIGIACADAGCPDEMDVADFIGDLHARAQTAATVVRTDEQMMAAIKSVCGFDAEKAEQWRPEALTITPAMVKAAMPWLTGLHHMRTTDAKEHIKEAIKAALTAAQSASGDTK